MAKNPRLLEVLLEKLGEEMYEKYNDELLDVLYCFEGIVDFHGKPGIDEMHKFCLDIHYFWGCAYDFNSECTEGNPREMYEKEVANGEKMSGIGNNAVFLKKGITEDNIGWYILDLETSDYPSLDRQICLEFE